MSRLIVGAMSLAAAVTLSACNFPQTTKMEAVESQAPQQTQQQQAQPQQQQQAQQPQPASTTTPSQ